MGWEQRRLNSCAIVSSPKDLFVKERIYQETLLKPKDWLEAIQSRLQRRWRKLSDKEREAYKQRFSNLPSADQPENYGNNNNKSCEGDYEETPLHKDSLERPTKRMRPSNPSQSFGELNSDCLLSVLGYLNHMELSHVRLVSQWFNQVAVNDYLWKSLFVAEFTGNHFQSDITGSDKNSDKCVSYRHRYQHIYQLTPKFSLKNKSIIEDVEHEGEYSEDYNRDILHSEYSVMYLDMSSASNLKISITRVHTLGVILSFLNSCGHIPRVFNDWVRIGYPDQFKLIKLSHFCYAVLHGLEHELYREEQKIDSDSDQEEDESNDKNDESNDNHDEDSEDDNGDEDEDEIDMETGDRKSFRRSRVVSVGIGPEVEGDFEPFIYYLRISPASKISSKKLFERPYSVYTNGFKQEESDSEDDGESQERAKKVDKPSATASEGDQFTSCYLWESDEKDWICPHFFNASFSWFYHLSVVSAYNEQKKQLFVCKTKEAYSVF